MQQNLSHNNINYEFKNNDEANHSSVQENILSYEIGLKEITALFNNMYKTIQIFENFQVSLLHRKKRDEMDIVLRNILAANRSLRKKDFESMSGEILSLSNDSERQIDTLLKAYIHGQKETIHLLITNLRNLKNDIQNNNTDRIKELHSLMQHIMMLLSSHGDQRENLCCLLREFQEDQKNLLVLFNNIVTQEKDFDIKKLKIMFKDFKSKYIKRVVRQAIRIQELKETLEKFKQDRIEVIKCLENGQESFMKQNEVSSSLERGNICNISNQ